MFGKSKTPPSIQHSPTPQPQSNNRKVGPSVLSSDINILGNIVSEGVLDINGRIEGNVKCENATIREQGFVKGDVVAEVVQIYGRIEGLVKAKHVVLFASAHVTGVIMHESLSIEDGAFVDGKFKRTDKVFIEDEMIMSKDDDEPAMRENTLDNLRLISG